jgi:ribosomal protein S18 acetylase RimI-like enzyme
MPEREPTIRPARKSDAIALAALIDIAGEGLPAFLWNGMKSREQSVFEFGRARALREQGNFSHRNASIVEIDGDVAGCLIDYRLDDPYVIGNLDELPEVVRPLVELEAKAPGSWYINAMAAFSEFRGQGIGARLLALAEQRGRQHEAESASLIVAGENTGAMRLYARTGYREVARATVVTFPGCAHGGDWVLMVKPI